MKKSIFLSVFSLVVVITTSFIKAEQNPVGTYGVLSDDPSQIRLVLSEDHTFTYRDFSIPSKKISVNGNWEQKNDKVILKNYDPEVSIHNKWKFSDDGKTAKSRKGMLFYTLGRI